MIEMLVSVAVFLLVISMSFATLLAATEVRKAASARIEIYQNARSVMRFIVEEIRTAKLFDEDLRFATVDSTNPTGIPFDPDDGPNNGRGRFQINDWPPYTTPISGRDKRVYTGNLIDDDGDGNTDEEAFDGLDNDTDGEQYSPMHPILQVAMADGLDNDENGLVDEGIDEDIFFPRDMINFVGQNSGQDVEIGYAIDSETRRNLMRRTARATGGENRVDGLYPVAVLYSMGQVAPDPYTSVPGPWFDSQAADGDDAEQFLGNPVNSNRQAPSSQNVTQEYELIAFNILGFDVKAYYYDYLIGEENQDDGSVSNAPPLIQPPIFQPPILPFHPFSFPALSWDSSYEQGGLNPYQTSPFPPGLQRNDGRAKILPNEPSDLAVYSGTSLFQSIQAEYPDDSRPLVNEAIRFTDGLPRLVEITLFVQDEKRLREDPVRVSTRVAIPFGAGGE